MLVRSLSGQLGTRSYARGTATLTLLGQVGDEFWADSGGCQPYGAAAPTQGDRGAHPVVWNWEKWSGELMADVGRGTRPEISEGASFVAPLIARLLDNVAGSEKRVYCRLHG